MNILINKIISNNFFIILISKKHEDQPLNLSLIFIFIF